MLHELNLYTFMSVQHVKSKFFVQLFCLVYIHVLFQKDAHFERKTGFLKNVELGSLAVPRRGPKANAVTHENRKTHKKKSYRILLL